MSEVLIGDYRGNAIMIIRASERDTYPFQFGIKKARLIVEHFEAIKKFSERKTLEEQGKVA